MAESVENRAEDSAWAVYNQTYSDNIHSGNLNEAYHALKNEVTDFACTPHTNPNAVNDFWHSLENDLNRLNPNILPKLSLVYGSEMNAKLTDKSISVDGNLGDNAPCASTAFSLLDASLKGYLGKQFNELKAPSATFSLWNSNPESKTVTKVTLDRRIRELNKSLPYFPVE